jgi:hypothetical protein
MSHLPGRFNRTGADAYAFVAACGRILSLARGAALVAAVLMLSACPDVKPPKDPRYIPHPKIEQPEESDMKKPRNPNRNPNRSPVTGDETNAPAGAQAGRQIGRQGQRASQQDPSMNPRTLADGQWREASKTPKDKEIGG